jgi:hypothetical protein
MTCRDYESLAATLRVFKGPDRHRDPVIIPKWSAHIHYELSRIDAAKTLRALRRNKVKLRRMLRKYK